MSPRVTFPAQAGHVFKTWTVVKLQYAPLLHKIRLLTVKGFEPFITSGYEPDATRCSQPKLVAACIFFQDTLPRREVLGIEPNDSFNHPSIAVCVFMFIS